MWLEGSPERVLGGHIGLISPLPEEENSGKSGNSPNRTLAFLPHFLSPVVFQDTLTRGSADAGHDESTIQTMKPSM